MFHPALWPSISIHFPWSQFRAPKGTIQITFSGANAISFCDREGWRKGRGLHRGGGGIGEGRKRLVLTVSLVAMVRGG